MKHAMPITTPRLIIRPVTLDDIDALQSAKVEVWGNLQLWMSWAYEDQKDRSATEKNIKASLSCEDPFKLSLAAFDKASGEFVCRTGLDPDEEDPRTFSTGYWVAQKYLGRGLAEESTNGVIRYAFNHLGAKAISISHFGGNGASQRIIEKLGFEALPVKLKAFNRCSDGTPLDVHDYILRDVNRLPKLDVHWV